MIISILQFSLYTLCAKYLNMQIIIKINDKTKEIIIFIYGLLPIFFIIV